LSTNLPVCDSDANYEFAQITFMELFSALGGAKVPLKFSVEQNNVRLGVDRGGSLLIRRKEPEV